MLHHLFLVKKSGSPAFGHNLLFNEVVGENPTLKFGTSLLPSTCDSFESAVTHLKTCTSNANLVIHYVPGDGNCLYWSILYQLKNCTASISKLRRMTAAYLESHSDFYSHFVGESIPPSNPMYADTEAPDDDDAQISRILDPHERSQAHWSKYLERIRHEIIFV